jgi:Predicted membrane protein
MFGKNKCKYTQDLKILFLVALLSIVFILIPPFSETPLRIPFALLLIFFIPGYTFISAMFPGNQVISGIERFTLSVGFSIIIMVFDGFLISLTVWKFRPNSITISLVLLTFIFGIIAYLARKRLPLDNQFSFSYKDFIHSLTAPETCNIDDEEENICYDENIDDKRFAARNRKKISSMRKPVKAMKKPALKTSERLPPEITKTLIIAMVLSIIVAGSMFAYAKATREKETFTTLYILGPDGKADNYPENFSINDPIQIIAGIENYEHAKENYTLEIILDGSTLNTMEITLDHGEKWEKELTITPTQSKQGKQKLELALYKGGSEGNAYRTVNLWVNQVLSNGPIITKDHEAIDFVKIVNPSMESEDGWEFTTTNDTIAAGYYENGTGIYGSRAFVINATYKGMLNEYNSHTLEQIIYSNRSANVILSCYIKDSYTKGTPDKDETQSKRIILNRNVIWSEGMNGDEGWQHLEIPITLQEGNNTLDFRMLQGRLQELNPVEMIIDEVSIIPESALSQYIRADNTVEFELPESKVLQLPKTSNTKFTVQWEGTDVGSGIYYYTIQYSTNGTEWKDWISKTAMTSAEFEGQEGVTYYFRSKAVDNALNEEMDKSTPDASTTIDTATPEIELDITPNPTSDVTYLTVNSNKALLSVDCLITPHNFGTIENIKLSTTDNTTWTSKYTVKVQDTYDIEVMARDYANNTAYTFGTLYTDESLEKLTIDFDPEETSDEVTITVTSSTALKTEPTVIVKDRYGHKLEVNYQSSKDNEYVYVATTNDDDLDYTIYDGTARVTVTAKTVNSMTLYEEDTFLIDRVDPTIVSFSPDDGETVKTNSPSIRASYSDDRAGIDKTKVKLIVNGIDVTSNAEIDYSSIYYLAQGLENGKVDVQLTVTDQAGNTKEKDWSFFVTA